MTAILEQDPEPISKIQPLAPVALDHIVHDCLAKDPELRWQSAADIGRELRWVSSSSSGLSITRTISVRRRLRERLTWGAVVVALLAALIWSNLREGAPARSLRSSLTPPSEMGFDFTGDFAGPPMISPDGAAVAFCARSPKERNSIWVQSLSELTAKKLDGTEGASFPFWSADGRFVGFFAQGHLKKFLEPAGQ